LKGDRLCGAQAEELPRQAFTFDLVLNDGVGLAPDESVVYCNDTETQKLWAFDIVEPGNVRFKETEVANLREFLMRGGTVTFDDFHGPIEWDNLEKELKRVFPNRKIVDLPASHPIFRCFYQIDGYPQTPPYEWWIWHDEPNTTDEDRPGLVQLRAARAYAKGGDAR